MTVDLRAYDVILINTSAGKDSQAMMDHLVRLARAQGVADRLVAVHCDLGRVEWAGTRELAETQATAYGLRLVVVSRPQGDLLQQVEQRAASLAAKGKQAAPWPSPTERWCTSDQKRGQVRRVMTQLVDEWRAAQPGKPRQCRVLNCMGLRAEESPARAKLVAFERDEKASNGKRAVDTWLPIHDWTTEQVWAAIRASGVPHHPAYDLGMGRLSCVFCIFAPAAQLMLAGQHNRELLAAYAEVEARVGYTFRKDTSLVQIKRRLDAGERVRAEASDAGCWAM